MTMLSGGFWAEGCGPARTGYAPSPPRPGKEPRDEDQTQGRGSAWQREAPAPELCLAVPQLPDPTQLWRTSSRGLRATVTI